MPTNFYLIDYINLPADKVNQVRDQFLNKYGLTGILGLEDNHLIQTDSYVSIGVPSLINDSFFPELAKLLDGTPEDGQLIKARYEEDDYAYFFHKGKVEQISGMLPIIDLKDAIPVGEKRIINIPVQVLGINGGTAAILDFFPKGVNSEPI
ncbi:MAG: hypothetical protein PHG51_06435 [Candidatus Omnitrophica bacterium]|nr:hypothetical protein [Candidatus Omnitrophota bacterium]